MMLAFAKLGRVLHNLRLSPLPESISPFIRLRKAFVLENWYWHDRTQLTFLFCLFEQGIINYQVSCVLRPNFC
jgi:hypothetical protein